jgi:hypothetical protein
VPNPWLLVAYSLHHLLALLLLALTHHRVAARRL